MSGGAFNYLCFVEPGDLIGHREELQDMAESLDKYGYPDIAQDTTKLIQKLDEINDLIEQEKEALEDVFHAVEWYESCDYNKEQMIAVLERYRESKNKG